MTPPEPAAKPAAARIAVVIGALLIVLAAVAGRDFLTERGAMPGPLWLRNTFEWLSRMTWHSWMLPAAIAALVVGAILLVAAFTRRAPTHLPTNGTPTLWLRATDVARMSTWAALHVDGVRRAQTTVGRRRARVRVTSDGRDAYALVRAVEAAVGGALHDLARPPLVSVRIDTPRSR